MRILSVTSSQRDEIGRHRGFKIPRSQERGGSSPPAGTTYLKAPQIHFCGAFLLASPLTRGIVYANTHFYLSHGNDQSYPTHSRL